MFDEVKIVPWSKEDFQYLIDNYKTMTYKEIGLNLERTEGAVRRKVYIERKKRKESNNE